LFVDDRWGWHAAKGLDEPENPQDRMSETQMNYINSIIQDQ
jgi:hypothetical protein